jgi:hypothetical protein
MVLSPFRRLRSRLNRSTYRLDQRVQAQRAIVDLISKEGVRVGLLTPRGPKGLIDWAYRVYWWLVFALVLIIPVSPGQPTYIFPAFLALAAAWLLTAPLYCQFLLTTDFSELRPDSGLVSRLIEALLNHRVDLPPELRNPSAVNEADASVAASIPTLLPATIIQMMSTLSVQAAIVSVIALVGLVAGPFLAEIHWGWLRGWSPVSLLYAVCTPAAILLLGSLVIPMVSYAYVANRRADVAVQEIERRREPMEDPPRD